MSATSQQPRRLLVWTALLFSALSFAVSWWHWWTFQYGTFDLAFYVQSLWLALRGEWMVSLLNDPLMGNHAEPIVFLLTPLFALFPHPMLFVAVQVLAFATMPFTAYRIGKVVGLEPKAALFMALATLVTPATFSIAIYEFHPEALAAPLILLLIEARLAKRYGLFWLWFLAVLSVKENMAPLLVMFGGVFAILEWKESRKWQFAWNLAPIAVAMSWLIIYGKVISPALNAGNVDYLQLYGHLGNSPGDIIRNFFVAPEKAFESVRRALVTGDMMKALLLPFLLLPLFRPRWLLIASPVLAQHLLSWRYSEWSLGAHYPAPFIPLFWVAAAEAIRRLRGQTAIAAVVLVACAAAHIWFGQLRDVIEEIPVMSATLEEREWKAQMMENIPETASVTASLGFLPHLATRERLVSLHHILKGLKTLSATAYIPPPPADVVLIDYSDGLTFSTMAGYYHPEGGPAEQRVPSSDRLLHDYLAQASWQTTSRNSMTVHRRGEIPATKPTRDKPLRIVEGMMLNDLQVSNRIPGVLQLRLQWELIGERKQFPWLMLVLSDGVRLYPFVKGACAIEAREGIWNEEWTVVFPSSMKAGHYAYFAEFYDANAAAWSVRELPPEEQSKRMPPNSPIYTLTRIDLGSGKIQPGNFEEKSASAPVPPVAPETPAAPTNPGPP